MNAKKIWLGLDAVILPVEDRGSNDYKYVLNVKDEDGEYYSIFMTQRQRVILSGELEDWSSENE
jgi:hypothetical protein